MIYIFLILPFLLFLVTSYVLNIRKISDGKFYIILLSLLEAVLSYIVVAMFFLQGYLPRFLYWFIAFFSLLVGSLLFFFTHKEDSDQWDLQLETIKNNILIFLKTLLPFYFFLIILRFWNPVLQIITALVLTILTIVIASCLRALFSESVKQFFRKLGMSSILKTLWLWVIVVIVVGINFFVQVPSDSIKSFFNLNDSVAYLTYDEMPIDLQNNYKQDTIQSLTLENNLEGQIIDFYYLEDTIYLYTIRNEILIIDATTSEILFEYKSEGSLVLDNSYNYQYDDYYNYFVMIDNKLLLFDLYGIYEMNSSGITKLEDMSKFYSKHYLVNDELWLIERTSTTDYVLYQYQNEIFIQKETIDTALVDYDYLDVISDELFQIDDNTLKLNSDSSVTFPYRPDISTVYDSEYKTMYYAEFIDGTESVLLYIKSKTIYEKITSDGVYSNIEVEGQHSTKITAYNNQLFVTGFKTLEILGSDFEFKTIFNHVDIKTFLRNNSYSSIDYLQFKILSNNNIEFIQVQKNDSSILVRIHSLEEMNNPLKLPFYTHYGSLTIIPILIACLFELTDYKKTINVISFENQVNRKKED